MTDDDHHHQIIDLIISFRGKKVEIPLSQTTSLIDVKSHLSNVAPNLKMTPEDIKLIHKGKVIKGLDGSGGDLFVFLSKNLKKKKIHTANASSAALRNENKERTIIRLIATGFSPTEAKDFEKSKQNAPRVKDDISNTGKKEIERRQRLGRKMMVDVNQKTVRATQKQYGFRHIETLPMLPDQKKAKEILHSLANDPGILKCMAKHQWNVGCLAELYPEGKVGESAVCVMGLNENRGAKILLRLRTDDLCGFRKILSIRKVLFHELAHNVHSEHNSDFFQLMRQVEKECNEMDWTQGSGLSDNLIVENHRTEYQGGAYRLGGEQVDNTSQTMTQRELSARAAMTRLSAEEQEIQDACGCNGMVHHSPNSNLPVYDKSKTTSHDFMDSDRECD